MTNEILLVGAGLLFLVTIEMRVKRKRALAALRELRALAHIVDMHQLTKDPTRAALGAVDEVEGLAARGRNPRCIRAAMHPGWTAR